MEFIIGFVFFCAMFAFGVVGAMSLFQKTPVDWTDFFLSFVFSSLLIGGYSLYKHSSKVELDVNVDKISTLTDRCESMNGTFTIAMKSADNNKIVSKFVCSENAKTIFETELNSVSGE